MPQGWFIRLIADNDFTISEMRTHPEGWCNQGSPTPTDRPAFKTQTWRFGN
jgi:hypothetical protein